MDLLDLETCQEHYFDDLSPGHEGWTPDRKHIWGLRPPSGKGSGGNQQLKLVELRTAQTVHTIGCAELDGQVPAAISIAPQGDRMYVISWDLDERGKQRDRYVWTAKPDGSGLRMVAKVDGAEILGWTHDGSLVIWNSYADGRTIVRLDLESGEQRVIFAPERR